MKKIFTSLIMFFILAFSALATSSAVGNLNITSYSDNLGNISVGQSVTGNFIIDNINDTINLTSINFYAMSIIGDTGTYNMPTSQISFTPSSVSVLNTTETKNIDFTLAVPADTYADTYNAVINASNSSANYDYFTTTFYVLSNPSLSVPSEIDLGTVNQNSTQTKTFLIINDGNTDLTSVNISTDAASKYNVTFNQTALFDLDYNQNKTITVTAYIPFDESGGTKTLGNIYVRSTEYNASSFPLEANVRGRLEIDDLDVEVDGDTDSNLDNTDKIDEKAKPESEIEFRIKIENGFTDEEDIEIENIQVTVTIEGIDDGDDLEEESDEFDLKAEESERVTLNFELPLESEEDDYTVLIHVEGEDENNIEHEIDWELELEVEKETHEIKIRKYSISPSTVICERRADINLELMNIGKNEEDEVYYLISNSDLGINIREGPFELTDDFDEEENRLEATHTVYIKDDQAAGTYSIELRAFYDTDKIDDYQRAILVVNDCVEEVEEEEEEVSEEGKEEEEVITTIPTIIQPEVSPPEITFKESTAYLALLGLLILTVGAGVVLLGAYYLSIRKKV